MRGCGLSICHIVLMRKAGGMESELKLSKTEIARLSAMNQVKQETPWIDINNRSYY